MKKSIVGLLVASSIAFAGIKNDVDTYKEFDKIPRVELSKMMSNEMARGMRLPMKIDEVTELTAIYNFDTTIFFKKEININYPEIKELWKHKRKQLINLMLKQDSQNVCYNPVWKYMIYKRDIIPQFNYVDTNNKPLFKYTIEIEDCRKLK